MNKYHYSLLFFWLSTTFSFGQINNPCDHPDYEALVAFNQAMNGNNWFTKWDLSDCDVCNWFGIVCNQENRVSDIAFTEDNGLKGQIPSSIQNFTELEGLIIINNNLQSTIPPEIGNLTKLRVLDLINCQIFGTIPPELGNLGGLIALLLQDNSLTGTIPNTIGNLQVIASLNFSNNQLSGALPRELAGVGVSFTQSVLIDLSNNNFEGCIPSTFELFCDSPIPNKYYGIDLRNNPNLTNDDFIQFCFSQVGLCPENGNTANCNALNFIGNEEEITVSGLTPNPK